MTKFERKQLCLMATEVAKLAYCPYSNFRVGAAVLGSKGITTGVNIENACYALGMCAERNALASAVCNGNTNISAIAIACIDASPNVGQSQLLPCGACRQWIQELAANAEIIIASNEKVFKLSDLLPNPFTLDTNKG